MTSSAPLPPPPLSLCHVCKLQLPASAFCKSDPAKYYACKVCEAKRQKARKRECLDNEKPVCTECNVMLKQPRTIRGMSLFECNGCTRKYRYRMKKDGTWSAGKRQCNFCNGYGCTSTRHVGTMRLPVVDIDASSVEDIDISSADDE